MKQKIWIVSFSPTGNTLKTLKAMAEELGGADGIIDLTVPGHAAPRAFDREDLVLLGAPVYGGRIPALARERFLNIRGNQTPCLVAVSYGNRDFDDALLELSDLAAQNGFLVKGAAAVVGRHTYGEIQVTRPDEADLAEDRAFARKAAARPEHAPAPVIPGNRPYKDGGKGGNFRPLTSDACVRCGLCVRQCPANAIAEDCRTIAGSCISCFRCIRSCPAGAKNMNVKEYLDFAAAFTEKLAVRRENQYFL